jgi:hypothetical protein
MHDFCVLGTPIARGLKQNEYGTPMNIVDHQEIAEYAMNFFRRLYLPLYNYMDLHPKTLSKYWIDNKDILGITHFAELLPEVLWIGPKRESTLLQLTDLRIKYKLDKYKDPSEAFDEPSGGAIDIKQTILRLKEELINDLEKEIIRRIYALKNYYRSPVRDPHLSLSEIYNPDKKKSLNPLVRAFNKLFAK